MEGGHGRTPQGLAKNLNSTAVFYDNWCSRRIPPLTGLLYNFWRIITVVIIVGKSFEALCATGLFHTIFIMYFVNVLIGRLFNGLRTVCLSRPVNLTSSHQIHENFLKTTYNLNSCSEFQNTGYIDWILILLVAKYLRAVNSPLYSVKNNLSRMKTVSFTCITCLSSLSLLREIDSSICYFASIVFQTIAYKWLLQYVEYD